MSSASTLVQTTPVLHVVCCCCHQIVLPAPNFVLLQTILHPAARGWFFTNWKSDHVFLLLQTFQWLPLPFIIRSKLSPTAFEALIIQLCFHLTSCPSLSPSLTLVQIHWPPWHPNHAQLSPNLALLSFLPRIISPWSYLQGIWLQAPPCPGGTFLIKIHIPPAGIPWCACMYARVCVRQTDRQRQSLRSMSS